MKLRWKVDSAPLTDGVTAHVAKWSRSWGWHLQRGEELPLLAKGNEATKTRAMEAAERAADALGYGPRE